MSITLQQLCEQSNYLYGMRVLAGEAGMQNIVQWVHTIEEEETSEFLHGGELIFTTGIGHKGNDWLLPFIKSLQKKKVSGLVLNYGPYMQMVHNSDVIKYCEQEAFPLLEVPWKTKLVDITRDFCNQIIYAERKEAKISQSFENLITCPYEGEKYLDILQKNGFSKMDRYCVVGASLKYLEDCEESKHVSLRVHLELDQMFQTKKGQYSYYLVQEPFDQIVIILCEYSDNEIQEIVDNLQNFGNTSGFFEFFYIAVSSNQCGLQNVSKSYNKMQMIEKLAFSQKRTPLYYKDLGVERLLLSISERDILEEYYRSSIGKLEVYDLKNDTDYMEVLKKYVSLDGSVQKVAEESGVHRNTINYQLGKIKKILGMELTGWQDKFQIILALQIKEIL